MRFEVPQFIEIEDKIFGPLTWRQFLYLGGGLGMAIVMFLTFPFILFVVFGLPLAVLAGALAFYPINNRPFSYFLEAIFTYLTKQRVFFWRQKSTVVYKAKRDRTDTSPVLAAPNPRTNKPQAQNISSLARKLELQALQKPQQ
ncbi:PrgI family protein [Candidatus Kaiserbacteria bacterium]|nr:PrgI family protein [Candidatus Kaiserbacteria bacterium]